MLFKRPFFALLLLLCGCQVGPHYKEPCVETPNNWKAPAEIQDEAPCPDICYWWEIFQDPTLNGLEELAIQNNPNLFVAMARINEAWANAGINRANLYPQYTLNPSYANTGMLFKIYLPPGVVFPVPDPTVFQKPFRIHQMQYTLPVNVNYEIDLWGKNQSAFKSAVYNAYAQEEAYRVSLLSLTTTLASSYFNLRTLDATIILLEKTLQNRRKAQELAQTRFEKGLRNYSDVASFSLEFSNTESDLQDALRQRTVQENTIATLIGIPAPVFQLERNPLTEQPPAIPAGIPSTVLENRPDIAEAERTMAAEHAQINVAYASYFPSFSLTGTLGYLSPTFKDFLTWKSRLWALGVSIAQILFDGGRTDSTVDASWARFAQATGAYQQQVLTAFEEVEDALNNLEYQKKQYDSLKHSVDDAERLVQISGRQFQQGLINYNDVVINERSELSAQSYYVNILGVRYQSTIQLIKALGGTWDCISDSNSDSEFERE